MRIAPSDSGVAVPMAYFAIGRRAESDAALAALKAGHALDAAYNIASVHATRGETDAAFEWLERAIVNQDSGLSDVAFEPALGSLHADPRWLPLLTRIGKSPAQLKAVRFDVALPVAEAN